MTNDNILRSFTLEQSEDDDVKTDLELHCSRCGEHLCDAEAGDDLGTLVSTVQHHHRQHEYSDTHVLIDSQVADAEDQIEFDLGLEYVYLNQPWSGGEEPVVTYDQFRSFISRQSSNDRNGTWGNVTISDDKSTLRHMPNDSDDQYDIFERVATGPGGEPLYAITGWTFYVYPRFDKPRTFTTNEEKHQ